MEYTVEDILDHHKMDDDTRIYLIKWKGYKDTYNTWEPEEFMINATEILNQYNKEHGLSPTKLTTNNKHKPKAMNKRKRNIRTKHATTNNMTDPSAIFRYINPLLKLKAYRSNLKVKQYLNGKIDQAEEAIYLYLANQHYYVIANLCKPVTKQIICDGANLSQNQGILETIRETTGLQDLEHIPYNQQIGNDHCASSAAAIILEILRLSKDTKELLTTASTIETSKKRREHLIRRMHKGTTQRTKPAYDISKWQKPECVKCGKKFLRRNAKLGHEAKCRGSSTPKIVEEV